MKAFGRWVANNPTLCICATMVGLWWAEHRLLYEAWDNRLSHGIFWLLVTGQVLFIVFLVFSVLRTKLKAWR